MNTTEPVSYLRWKTEVADARLRRRVQLPQHPLRGEPRGGGRRS